MNIEHLIQAIFNLAPGAEFAFQDDDLSTLDWQSPEIAQPSNSAITAEAKRIASLPIAEPTVADKLAKAGLSIDELKAALGL